MSFKKRSDYLSVLLLALSVAFLSSLWGFVFGTNDDVLINNMAHGGESFEQVWHFAKLQGRYTYILHYPFMILPYIFGKGSVLYDLIKCSGFVFLFASIAWALARFRYSKQFITLYIAACILFWLDSWEHSLLSSYPFSFVFILACAVIGFALFDKYLETQRVVFLIAALSIWFYFAQEYLLQFSFLPLYLCWRKRRSSPVANRAALAFALMVFTYLVCYLGFRYFFGSDYKGNQLQFDLPAAIKTLWQLSIAGLPGYIFFSQSTYEVPGWPVLNFLLVCKLLFMLGAVFLLDKSTLTLPDKSWPWFVLLALLAAFAASSLLSLSVKYQNWVLYEGVESYLSSHIAYLVWVMLLIAVLFRIAQKVPAGLSFRIFKVVVFFIGVSLVIATEAHNQKHRIEQKQSYARWQLFDQWIDTLATNIPEGSHIYAVPFINYRSDLMISNSGPAWTIYQYLQTGRELFVFAEYWVLKKAKKSDIRHLYHMSFGEVDRHGGMYLLFSEIEARFRNKDLHGNKVSVLFNQEFESLEVSGVLLEDAAGLTVNNIPVIVEGKTFRIVLDDVSQLEINAPVKIDLPSLKFKSSIHESNRHGG